VRLHGTLDRFKVTQMIWGKTQFADYDPRFKDGGTALNDLDPSLRAFHEAAVRGVSPLENGVPFPPRLILQLSASQPIATDDIALKEY